MDQPVPRVNDKDVKRVVRREIKVAKRDYRDMVAYAEYPEYMQSVSPSNSLSPKQVQAIIDGDWLHYNRWLNE